MSDNNQQPTTESNRPALPAVVVRGGFVYSGEVKLCRVTPGGVLLFLDKDKRRIAERRRQGQAEPEQVPVTMEALVQAVQAVPDRRDGLGEEG